MIPQSPRHSFDLGETLGELKEQVRGIRDFIEDEREVRRIQSQNTLERMDAIEDAFSRMEGYVSWIKSIETQTMSNKQVLDELKTERDNQKRFYTKMTGAAGVFGTLLGMTLTGGLWVLTHPGEAYTLLRLFLRP